ncbi:TPA: hypothetical protein LZ311_005717, partial [Enterobacter asburiae]|nr:hypothetical protein [Enterobacter asburiae]
MTINLKSASIMILFVLVLLVQIMTPFHSDDFGFYLRGYSFNTIHDVYMSWSGRVTSDFIGGILMSINNKILISLINSMAMIGLILLISNLNPNGKKISHLFALLFCLYWVDNPSLNQVNFWIVGSANYMWTNLIAYGWLFLSLRVNLKSPLPVRLATLTLAFLTGLTTENLGPTMLVVSALILCFKFYNNKKIDKFLLLQSTMLLLGSAILILSPGNKYRSEACCAAFNELPTLEKLKMHFPWRFLNEMYEYKFTLLILIVFIAYAAYKKISVVIPVILLLCACLSNAVLFVSPATTGRVLNTGLLLCIAALSLVSSSILEKSFFKISSKLYLTFIVVIFSISYHQNFHSLYGVYGQNMVRNEMIKNGEKSIPRFYQSQINKKSDEMDNFFNEEAIAKFYGVSGKIKEYDIPFDYSRIDGRFVKLNDEYFLGYKIIDDVVVFEVKEEFKPKNGTLFFHIKTKNNVLSNQDFAPEIRKLYGRTFINSYKI